MSDLNVFITGSGDKAFVAGGDLKELQGHPEPEAGARLNRVMGTALARSRSTQAVFQLASSQVRALTSLGTTAASPAMRP